MDTLLTHGYFLHEDEHEKKIMKPYPPLGLLYISAYLKSRGFGVEVFDTTFSTKAEFLRYLQRVQPPIVGIYCNLMTKFNVLEMIAACKRLGAYVVLGGPEPPHYAEEYLAHGADVVVVGEGELALEELIPALMKSGPHRLGPIPGLVYLNESGNVVRTAPRPYIQNLDALPLPDRAAIDIPRYVATWRSHHGRGSLSVICARGCPYHCTWCSHSVFGESHRRRSPGQVAEEVAQLMEAYHPDQLWYADDVFTIHYRWLFEYANALRQRAIKLPFECITRADRLNDEVIQTLAEMGCYRVWIGSESGSQRILDAMRREVTVEEVQWATRALQKRGIEVGMFIMLGYEGEELDDIRATVDHLKKAGPNVFLSTVAYPIRGTPFYEQVEDRILRPARWENWTDRQLTLRGRPSRRFYAYVQRWMAGEFHFHRQWHDGRRNFVLLAKSIANIGLGRLGMTLTAREVER